MTGTSKIPLFHFTAETQDEDGSGMLTEEESLSESLSFFIFFQELSEKAQNHVLGFCWKIKNSSNDVI